ncbi:MAG TPA: hypothetical protein VK427_22390, partial [Kofleriaceae bacterium]|nr:hypothetical protein [Kofleriaceae bacterium]
GDGLVDPDGIPDCLEPSSHDGFGDGFAKLGYDEVSHGGESTKQFHEWPRVTQDYLKRFGGV